MIDSTRQYATDEDVAIRVSTDYALVCPRDQVLVSAKDGVFDPSDRWTLLSPSTDFVARGVRPGQTVQLADSGVASGGAVDVLVVERVARSSLGLRRKGLSAGMGEPPGPIGGAIGRAYFIASLDPQLVMAGEDLARRFDLGDARELSQADRTALRDLTVLMTVRDRYLDLLRNADPHRDEFAAKAAVLTTEIGDRLARLTIPSAGSAAAGPVGRFSTRMSR